MNTKFKPGDKVKWLYHYIDKEKTECAQGVVIRYVKHTPQYKDIQKVIVKFPWNINPSICYECELRLI